MCKLRQLGSLEVGFDTAVATDYDPLGDDTPELARILATSVQQHIAFGERASQKDRRTGLGFGAEGVAQAPAGWIIPTPHQQGVEDQEDSTAAEVRLCGGHGTLPWCQRGSLRISTAITQGEVITGDNGNRVIKAGPILELAN
jgi:hypothetical protein